MSRGASNTGGLGPLGRSLALGAPALTALTLAAIVGLPPTEPDQEMQLLAPDRVPAEAIVPLRAHLYAGLRRAEGPALVSAPVRVELRGLDSRRWASTTLRPGFGTTLEGELRVPRERHGRATLIAIASYGGAQLSVERPLRVDRPHAPPQAALSPAPRELPALRSLALGPLRSLRDIPVAPFDLRIRGGACVPEAPCELLVALGTGVTAFAEASASVSIAAQAGSAPGPIASLLVTPHGPEAELSVRVDDTAPLARASVRLALALGSHAIASAPDVLRAGEPLRVALHGQERGCIVDAFQDGRWARTGSLRDCQLPSAAPFTALEPGRWRVQLRRDRFGSDNAAVRELYVARRDETPALISTRLARAVLELEPDNTLARSVAGASEAPLPPGPGDTLATRNIRYLLAVLDRGIVALPVPSSGHAAAVLRMQAARAQLRKLGLLALGACALTLVALLGQRGLDAAGEASRLLVAGGTDPGTVRRARMRMALRVLATLCALLLAFAVIAAYVVARAASL
jgi:hypothetical protein